MLRVSEPGLWAKLIMIKIHPYAYEEQKLPLALQIEDKFNEIINGILEGGEEKFNMDRMHTLSELSSFKALSVNCQYLTGIDVRSTVVATV